MLTDDYAVWQPTKVNTGASFNLLQSQSLPCWARLRCTGLLAKAWPPASHLPVPGNGLSSHQAVPSVDRAKGQERVKGGGGEEDWPHTGPSLLPPPQPVPCLPSILFTLRPEAPWASAQQAGPRPASALHGSFQVPSWPSHKFLPALPKVQPVTRALKREGAVSSSYSRTSAEGAGRGGGVREWRLRENLAQSVRQAYIPPTTLGQSGEPAFCICKSSLLLL